MVLVIGIRRYRDGKCPNDEWIDIGLTKIWYNGYPMSNSRLSG